MSAPPLKVDKEESFDDWLTKDPPTSNTIVPHTPSKTEPQPHEQNQTPKSAPVADTADEDYKHLFAAISNIATCTPSGHDAQRKARVVAVVVTKSGKTFKMHTNPPMLVALAEEKARLAVGLSDDVFAVSSSMASLYTPNTAHAGGLPIYKNGKLVAAVGISGDDPAVDESIGKTALKTCGYTSECGKPTKNGTADVKSCIVKAEYPNDARKKIVEATNKRGVYFVYDKDKGGNARHIHCKHTFTDLKSLTKWAGRHTPESDACPRCDAKIRYK